MSQDSLLALLTSRIANLRTPWVRIAVDGPAFLADAWAVSLVDSVREVGRSAVHVRTADFLRPASLRYEFGKTNPDAFYEGWFDLKALQREVLDPLSPGGSGRILPTFWDPVKDRNTRSGYQEIPAAGVLVLSGPLLLGAGLPFELEVHLELSPAALARRIPPDEAWSLPAYERYAAEVGPAGFADVVIRLNDPAHPALVTR
jgi:hypothetical protein